MRLSRRHALLAGGALPLLGLARPLVAQEDHGAAPAMAGPPTVRSFAFGEGRMTSLLSAAMPLENPHTVFGLNVDDATFAQVSEENFLPSDRAMLSMSPALLEIGDARILFDTGFAAEGTVAALQAAGYAPGDVTHVVLTHMHPDHIGGLIGEDGSVTFEAASHHAGRVEFDYWAGQANDAFEAKVRPLADRLTFIEGEGEVLPGVAAMETFGHTPGHLSYEVTSGEAAALILGDVANHYVWSVGHPDWEVSFDTDKAMARETRQRVLAMLAERRLAVQGYHMPFPALGFVATDGEGFRWVPATYQFDA
jgi:glyoxylase-like metal-dependent hydrolase (beta-lactamase superfamily II)